MCSRTAVQGSQTTNQATTTIRWHEITTQRHRFRCHSSHRCLVCCEMTRSRLTLVPQCTAVSLCSVRMCWVAIVSFYLTVRSALECWHDREVPQSALERLLCNGWKWETKKIDTPLCGFQSHATLTQRINQHASDECCRNVQREISPWVIIFGRKKSHERAMTVFTCWEIDQTTLLELILGCGMFLKVCLLFGGITTA